ncbi:predicted protein [Naegleria gruberi]|uniref:Predicted protein n=1 Tax=Naegleria gruberi TaxID=5762 RepID=D2VXF4_NAEGR|nr:uncharacterized protein NAEGRDRAFT_73728 [Naegleria gruberi]EFC38429.1 predicted protein [Naegleria gruberi]|eukprot:XP_002671173.1 predicted protein [Naegleria gruberi strain NEG-M]
MKLWELESFLQDHIQNFQKPKIKLEQYITTPHLASHTLYTAQFSFDDIEGKEVLDLGIGTGMLGLGACLLEAKHVTGVDIDEDALNICRENVKSIIDDVDEEMAQHFTYRLDLIQSDVLQFERMIKNRAQKLKDKYKKIEDGYRLFDTVLLNPPFGTRIKGADMMFLKVASELTRNAVYSLHKTSTRDYVTQKAAKWGFEVKVVAELNYDLEASYSFHKKKSQQIQVDLIRLKRKK